jgi:hypothetical protein
MVAIRALQGRSGFVWRALFSRALFSPSLSVIRDAREQKTEWQNPGLGLPSGNCEVNLLDLLSGAFSRYVNGRAGHRGLRNLPAKKISTIPAKIIIDGLKESLKMVQIGTTR